LRRAEIELALHCYGQIREREHGHRGR
jgi:hypothetical protein